ncbi:hypothetical protein TYRP_010399 [Tyrophagus putrescentiae]|nr:hypothetical protein TYRP_010399 [Tyrophagus putrescentiae]
MGGEVLHKGLLQAVLSVASLQRHQITGEGSAEPPSAGQRAGNVGGVDVPGQLSGAAPSHKVHRRAEARVDEGHHEAHQRVEQPGQVDDVHRLECLRVVDEDRLVKLVHLQVDVGEAAAGRVGDDHKAALAGRPVRPLQDVGDELAGERGYRLEVPLVADAPPLHQPPLAVLAGYFDVIEQPQLRRVVGVGAVVHAEGRLPLQGF